MIRRAICRICRERIEWRPSRSAWVHVRRGVDHAPIPEVTA